MRRRCLTVVIGLSLCGCASVPPTQVGQTLGAILGSAIAPGLGAPLGSLVGLLGGMLVQGQIDKATETKERRTLSDQLAAAPVAGSEPAAALTGEPTRVWVDERMQNGRLIAGHFDTRPIP
jgi:hypothetical protein